MPICNAYLSWSSHVECRCIGIDSGGARKKKSLGGSLKLPLKNCLKSHKIDL